MKRDTLWTLREMRYRSGALISREDFRAPLQRTGDLKRKRSPSSPPPPVVRDHEAPTSSTPQPGDGAPRKSRVSRHEQPPSARHPSVSRPDARTRRQSLPANINADDAGPAMQCKKPHFADPIANLRKIFDISDGASGQDSEFLHGSLGGRGDKTPQNPAKEIVAKYAPLVVRQK